MTPDAQFGNKNFDGIVCEFLSGGTCSLNYHRGRPFPNQCRACIKHGENKRGLGSKVEIIAKPIASMIDRIAGTNLRQCGGCERRKRLLNRSFPNT